ncbi:MAG: nucleoside triphosphate pyrophosphatase [bacterium]
MKIILASDSQRRKDLLSDMGFDFSAVKHRFDEESVLIEDPSAFVEECSLKKAMSVRDDFPEDIIAGSDTVVNMGGSIIGKPLSADEAEDMLRGFSGRQHYVYTGITLIYQKSIITENIVTSVRFKNINEGELNWYLSRADYMDKAGAYAIQKEASFFIEAIDGDYFNVVGFPLRLFSQMLKEITGEEFYEFIH